MDPAVQQAQARHQLQVITGDEEHRPSDRCHLCFACHQGFDELIREEKIDEFKPTCQLSSDIRTHQATEEAGLDEYEEMYLSLAYDPVEWAKLELNWTGRWYQEEVLRCSSQHKLLRMGRRCMPGDQLVAMGDGTFKRIDQIRAGERVLSRSIHSCRVVKSVVTEQWSNGVKDIYEIRLSDGHSVRCTANHPLLSIVPRPGHGSGAWKKWRSIEDGLSIGDKVYLSKRGGVFGDANDVPRAKLLGYLLTDGYIACGGQTPKFTSCDEMYLDEVQDLVRREFGLACNRRPSESRAWHLYLTDGNKGTGNPVAQWIEQQGLAGTKAATKHIPDWLFRSDADTVAAFLNRAWSGDGCVYVGQPREGRAPVVELSLTSAGLQLLQDIRLLLSKFGVNSRIKEERGRNNWKLCVTGASDIETFFDEIDLVYGKEKKSQEALEVLEGITTKRFRTKGTKHFRPCRIRTIEKVGREETYDISVRTHHNFIVDSVLVHNTGKTTALAVDILHKAYTREKIKVLVVTPFQEQAELVFGMIDTLLEESTTMQGMVKRYVRHPSHTIEFNNGSQIKAMTAGVKTGSQASKIRGQDADHIAIDEADMLGLKDLESILAIIVSHPHVSLWVSGTPTGKREHFYSWATDPNKGFKNFHFPSSFSPTWKPQMERWLRDTYSESGYIAEFDAGFPVLKEGVFPLRLVDESLKAYDPERLVRYPDWIYGVGVDWNDTDTGANIVLVGFNPQDGKFWFVRKWIISRERFTQLSAVQKIVEVNAEWRPSFIYVDSGFGTTQVELLHTYGRNNPPSQLLTKVKAVAMGGKVIIQDPYEGQVKKHTKPFVVGMSVRRFEQGQVVLPVIERRGEGTEGLVDQIDSYIVERYTTEGRPIYSQEGDHTLTAWMLAIYGFWMEHTDVSRATPCMHIGHVSHDKAERKVNPADYPFPTITFELERERIVEEKDEKRQSLLPSDRGFDITAPTGRASDVRRLQQSRARMGGRRTSFFSRRPPPRRGGF